MPPVLDNGSEAGSDADEPEVTGVAGDELNRSVAAVCTIVGCCRPSRMTAQFFDESGMHTGICCEPCVIGDGHTAECDASSAAWRRQRQQRRQQQRQQQQQLAAPPADSPAPAEVTLDSVTPSGRWASSEPERYCTRGGRVDVMRARQATQRTLPEVLER